VRAETRHQLKQDRFSKVTSRQPRTPPLERGAQDENHRHRDCGDCHAQPSRLAAGITSTPRTKRRAPNFRRRSVPLKRRCVPQACQAQPGYDSFASSTERATTRAQTVPGALSISIPTLTLPTLARYFVGLASSQLGDNAAAERSLQQAANSSNSDLAALGKFALASVYRARIRARRPVDLYKQLIDKPTIVVSKATAQIELAGFYESQQKPDEAKKLYDQVAKENPSTEAASLAQRRAAALK